jgi:phage shock protein A
MKKQASYGSRLFSLWRGIWGLKVESQELKHAEVVFFNAIREQEKQNTGLRDAVSQLIYQRNRLEQQISQKNADFKLVQRALEKSALDNDDTKALAFIKQNREIENDSRRLKLEFEKLNLQSIKAKSNLLTMEQKVKSLKTEQAQMVARKNVALARKNAKDAVDLATCNRFEAPAFAALDQVRESIERLETLVEQQADFEEATESNTLQQLKNEQDLEDDTVALAQIKLRLKGHLLPMPQQQSSSLETSEPTLGFVEATR